MLSQLFDALAGLWGRIIPWVVIAEFEGGGVMRWGRYRRTLGPGFHWRWPLIEEVMVEYTAMTTLRLQPQTCTTKDGKGVVVEGMVKYRINDVRPYICGVVDQKDVLVDVSMGAILRAIMGLDYEDLLIGPPESKIQSAIKRQVSGFGFEILSFTFTDLGLVRSIRLIGHNPTELHGE